MTALVERTLTSGPNIVRLLAEFKYSDVVDVALPNVMTGATPEMEVVETMLTV